MRKIAVVVPNWNGMAEIGACLDALLIQSEDCHVIVVENASTDGSLEYLHKNYSSVEIIVNETNLGFAGGVNCGIRSAIEQKFEYVALLNNDAVADPKWLENLQQKLATEQQHGIATSKILNGDGSQLDSTGDYYTNWGLPYPRGRGEHDVKVYDQMTEVFSASGGASLYRVSMLEEIGLFDEDFFAYYEDVDISFRAQLAGWKVAYFPEAKVHHQIGATSSKVKGFTTYQTMKNQPLLLLKNVPRRYLFSVGWRFTLAHTLFFLRAVSRGQGWIALKGDLKGTQLLFTGFKKRKQIQGNKKVSDEYIWSMMVHDLPPNAHALRKLRAIWWKLTFRRAQ
ncbi:MAG: glycosyltransferase family 2 protein [Patescibacteria group bacterium]|nr:glycosyltransferase family 2 protein [Patescibacteria group bacterium]